MADEGAKKSTLGGPGEAHLWFAEPGVVGLAADEACALLDPAERRRMEGFRFEPDRALFGFAHAFLRTTLARYADAAPSALRLVAAAGGRPELAQRAGSTIRFSLAHAAGLVACLVALVDCGVDVERHGVRLDLTTIAPLALAPQELQAWRLLRGTRRESVFLRLWTLKEAYVKARGVGMKDAFERIAFARLAAAPPRPLALGDEDDERTSWRWWTGRPRGGYTAAVALRSTGPIALTTFRVGPGFAVLGRASRRTI